MIEIALFVIIGLIVTIWLFFHAAAVVFFVCELLDSNLGGMVWFALLLLTLLVADLCIIDEIYLS